MGTRPRTTRVSKVELSNISAQVSAEAKRRLQVKRSHFEEIVRPLANEIMAAKIDFIIEEHTRHSLSWSLLRVNYRNVWNESVDAAKKLLNPKYA